MEDGLNAVLEPRHLAHQLRPLGSDPPLKLDLCGRHPDLGEELCRVQPRQGRSVDLVRLDLGPGNGSYLKRVGDDHAASKRRQQLDDDADGSPAEGLPAILASHASAPKQEGTQSSSPASDQRTSSPIRAKSSAPVTGSPRAICSSFTQRTEPRPYTPSALMSAPLSDNAS